jgi:ABC-type multidrug transport system fused ATPase/permease subunit
MSPRHLALPERTLGVSEHPGDPKDWMRYAHLTEEQRLMMLRHGGRSRVAVSGILIAIGVLLFLSNLGIIPIRNMWDFWPAIPIAIGLGSLVNARNTAGRLWGFLLMGFGAVFLLLNLGMIRLHTHDGSLFVSVVLIAVGFAALSGVSGQPHRRWFGGHHFPRPRVRPDYESAVNDYVVFGALRRKLESNDFRGGDLIAIFGNIDIDLRRALITPAVRSAQINAMTVFGATKIRVPQSWRVAVSGVGILGNFEDKTIPPNTGPDAPTLIVTGYSIFGSVEIED